MQRNTINNGLLFQLLNNTCRHQSIVLICLVLVCYYLLVFRLEIVLNVEDDSNQQLNIAQSITVETNITIETSNDNICHLLPPFPFIDEQSSTTSINNNIIPNIIYLQGGLYGRTCNNLHSIIGAVLYAMPTSEQQPIQPPNHNRITIGIHTDFAHTVKWLDFTHAYRYFTLLINCERTRIQSTRVICQQFMGHHPITKKRQFEWIEANVKSQIDPGDAFMNSLEVLKNGKPPFPHKWLIPVQSLRNEITQWMKKLKQQQSHHHGNNNNNLITIGVHRRGLENQCKEEIKHHPYRGGSWSTCVEFNLTKRLYLQNHWIQDTQFTCNFTLDIEQTNHLFKKFNDLQSRINTNNGSIILLSSDGQDPYGDGIILRGEVDDRLLVRYVTSLQTLSPACAGERMGGKGDVFSDLWWLVLVDYHLENPASSCGIWVALWRKMFQQSSMGDSSTSYPVECYGGIYDGTILL
jgi:hypothetical protein